MTLFYLLLLIVPASLLISATKINVLNGDLNRTVTVNVSKNDEMMISYNYNQSTDDDTYLRAYMEAALDTGQSALIILKDNDDQVIHVKLTYKNVTIETAERTICPILSVLAKDITQQRKLTVDISSESIKPIKVSIVVRRMDHFQLELGKTRDFQIDDMSPVFFLYKFNEHIEQVNVKVESTNSTCMILSIQDAMCPVYDIIENVKFKGMYQSVTTSGSIIPEGKYYTQRQFFIVFVLNYNEMECRGWNQLRKSSDDVFMKTKILSVTIDPVPSSWEYIWPVFGMTAFYLAFFVISLSISFFYKHFCHRDLVPDTEEITINDNELGDPSGRATADEIADMKTLYSRGPRSNYKTFGSETDNSSTISRVKTLDSDDGSYDSVSDVETDPNVYRLNTSLYVSDLSKKHSAVLNRKYFLYLWYLVIISVFYALPVVQLVITYQKVVRSTGNEDMCYYNFKCTRPLYIFTAFNNIISNVGYVLLGLLFTLITWRRHSLYNECKLVLVRQNKGIPQYYGLFYAMGVALTMEGILSACYHICPSNNNFQFDTAYMYILACLCMIKIYQTRHPDVNASAHSFYMTMSFIIFVGVLGVVYNILLFWVFFTVFYIAVCILLTMEVYYMGRWRLDIGLPRRVYLVFINDKWMAFMPTYKRRMIFLLMLNIVNISFALYGGINKQRDFASFFLAIFMFNLLIYFLFYIVMKMRHCEHFHVLPIIYVVIAMICWAFAIYCFILHPTDWQLTPAKSRELNRDCMFLNFYDLHDVWHFLSSLSMFFSFMALQNLDDSLFNVDRDKIPVF